MQALVSGKGGGGGVAEQRLIDRLVSLRTTIQRCTERSCTRRYWRADSYNSIGRTLVAVIYGVVRSSELIRAFSIFFLFGLGGTSTRRFVSNIYLE